MNRDRGYALRFSTMTKNVRYDYSPVIPHEMQYPFKRIFRDSAIWMRNDLFFQV